MQAQQRRAFAAQIFACGTFLVVLFQIALAAGAPWGELAWGGRFPGTLPVPMRIASAVAVVILVGFAAVVLTRARLCAPAWYAASKRVIWIVVAYFVVGVITNATTPSESERAIWLSVTILLGCCSIVVAAGRDWPCCKARSITCL
jgi:hypothetical protein